MAERHPRTIELRDGKARAFVYPEHGFLPAGASHRYRMSIALAAL